jgi:hypothetical protein
MLVFRMNTTATTRTRQPSSVLELVCRCETVIPLIKGLWQLLVHYTNIKLSIPVPARSKA